MLVKSFSRRAWITALVGFMAVSGVAAPIDGDARARADEVKALYDVSFMGIAIAKGSLALRVERGAYAAKLHISTAGLARVVSSEESYVDAKGYLGRTMVPASYDLLSRGKRVTQVEMSLSGGNVRGLKAVPQLAHLDNRVPVTYEAKRHVVDPLSAAIVPVSTGRIDAKVCDRTLPVFDGWTRYDIALSYSGTEPVAIPGFKGDAIRCDARWVPVAGHLEDSKSTAFMRDNRDISVWFVPIADSKLVIPYKISVQTMRGRLMVTASQFVDPSVENQQVAN